MSGAQPKATTLPTGSSHDWASGFPGPRGWRQPDGHRPSPQAPHTNTHSRALHTNTLILPLSLSLTNTHTCAPHTIAISHSDRGSTKAMPPCWLFNDQLAGAPSGVGNDQLTGASNAQLTSPILQCPADWHLWTPVRQHPVRIRVRVRAEGRGRAATRTKGDSG